MTPSASPPLYQSLDPSKSQIRLLQIHRVPGPIPPQDKITYTLTTVSLHDNPKFTALSYVWGNPKVTKPITVNNHTVHVTTNLANGLRCLVNQLDSPDGDTIKSIRLWVDAICVNQDDVAERNHQVKLMRDVYSSAEHVFAWLGIPKGQEARKGLSRGLRVINAVYEVIKDLSYEEFSGLSWAPRCPFLTQGSLPYGADGGNEAWNIHVARGAGSCVEKNWLAVDGLLRLRYWQRVWIVQETAFAKSLVLFCKTWILHAHKLELFGDYFGRLQKHAMESVLAQPTHISFDCWWYMTAADAIDYTPLNRLRVVREHAKRLQLADHVPHEAFDSGWIISTMTNDLVATDSRDYIYGLIGLSGIDIVPDYDPKLLFLDVFLQYVVSWLEAYRNKPATSTSLLPELFFLSLSGDGFFAPNLAWEPSWAPNFPTVGHCMIASELKTAGPDTGLPHNVFSPEKAYIVGKKLFAHGVTISPVERCHDPFQNLPTDDVALPLLLFFREYVDRNAAYKATGIPALQALFRVVTRDASNRMDRITLMRALGLLSRFCRTALDSITLAGQYDRLLSHQEHDILCRDVLGPLLGYHGTDANLNLMRCFEENFFPGCDVTETNITTNWAMLSGLMGREKNDAIIQADWQFQSKVLQGFLDKGCQFIETENGLVGVAPKYAAPGDVVCVLSGSSLPVVLRRVGEHYIHLGTCWVLGLMNGETAATAKEGDIERFEIW